ncbi:ankyrin repeat protein [Botrytis cinerea]
MAELHPANTGGANGTAAFNKDFFDDSAPQKLIDDEDFVSLYLRCRYDRRGNIEAGRLHDFVAGLPGGLREKFSEDYEDKIKRELDRIAELRALFVGKPRNRPEIVKLNTLKAAWKRNAINSCHANLNSNKAGMNKLIKERVELQEEFETFKNEPAKATQIGKDLETKDAEIQTAKIRADNKDKILKEVAKWDLPGDLVAEEGKDVRDGDGYGFTVSKITLEKEKSDNAADTASFNKYQMKRYSVLEVLEPKDGHDPWARENTESIRYFHFPANNMEWIERAIEKHYNETKNHRPQTSKILSRELWTGQQHGTPNDPLHARHMRSHCKCIPQDSEANASHAEHHHPSRNRSNNNIVLFMPYLHWEMDRKRAHLANVAKTLTSQYREKQTRYDIRNKNILADIAKDNKKKFGFLNKVEDKEPTKSGVPVSSGESKQTTGFRRFFPINSKISADQKVLDKAKTLCGRYLMQVARVYEAMDLEPDVMLVHSHLHKQLPIHPRRTLDQSYYFKLENTEPRDRDQVVYRGTNERRIINGSTRVVMVDQLWMYILDEHTIITSFPKRLGRNKPDSSGVHRCIRDRLEHLRPGQINSVYDLAHLIINECSMVFFDRTKPTDERPEVLDIFADAIGYISEMKTSSFELFWRHLKKLSSQRLKISPKTARLYLNINPEGVLLQEAHDIIEELKMMSRINMQQLQVTQAFSKALETINGQIEPMQEMSDLLSLMLDEMRKKGPWYSNGMPKGGMSPAEDTSTKFKKFMIKHTIDRSLELVDTISHHHTELHQLEDSAREIADQLRDLLTLKQQQASIIEATASLDRADESVHQGRSIMIFTVITIIFLPLSFMSSIFGMNAVEFTGPSNSVMGIREQFEFMFPISIFLTLFFLYLALKAPRPKLKILPFFLFFPIVIIRASWYGLRGKPKKWERLFLYLYVGSANEKLGDKYREMVTAVYQWCSGSKAKDTTKSQPSANKEQAVANEPHNDLAAAIGEEYIV